MKKYIVGAVFSLGILVSPAFTQAASLSSTQIQSILTLLYAFGADSATIANVNAALTGSTSTTSGTAFCHNFNSDLTVGSNGGDVSALSQALSISGIDTAGNDVNFTENDAADVVAFQSHYGIRQTGYVGPMTRAKLNALYGCRNGQQSTQTTTSTVSPATTQPTQSVTPTATTQSVNTAITPRITEISSKGQSSGLVVAGQTAYISGTGLGNGKTIIVINGTSILTTPYSDTVVTFTVPTLQAYPRVFNVSVTNSAGLTSNDYPMTVLLPSSTAPSTISEVDSKGGSAGEVYANRLVYINGTGLKGNITVKIGGQSITAYSDSDTLATFTAPSFSTYPTTTAVSVINSSGVSSNNYQVVVTSLDIAPTIDTFSVNGYSQTIDGVVNVYNAYNPVVQWTSSNASYCRATSVEAVSGATTTDFTGTQPTSGSAYLQIGDTYYNQRKITLTCYSSSGIPSDVKRALVGGKG